jgi:hypothetical protein
VALSVALLQSTLASAQEPQDGGGANRQPSWAFTLTVDGYIVPDQTGFVSPTFAADRGWLHLEARYNYENLRTGSVWFGYNFSAGKELTFSITPMAGAVFGRTTGIAPGCEASLAYKIVELSVTNEVVVDLGNKNSSFYYTWPQLTFSPLKWLRVGLVAQRTKVYHTGFDTQRGFLVGVSHKKVSFTAYIFNVAWTRPTVVLEAGVSF